MQNPSGFDPEIDFENIRPVFEVEILVKGISAAKDVECSSD
jgi:hypothetical protein